jgi:hypothetical protein
VLLLYENLMIHRGCTFLWKILGSSGEIFGGLLVYKQNTMAAFPNSCRVNTCIVQSGALPRDVDRWLFW